MGLSSAPPRSGHLRQLRALATWIVAVGFGAGSIAAAPADFGVEIELRMPILLPSDPTLVGRTHMPDQIYLVTGTIPERADNVVLVKYRGLEGPEVFHIDVDHTFSRLDGGWRAYYSNVEIVSAPFDQHAAATSAEAFRVWSEEFRDPMCDFWSELQQVAYDTPLCNMPAAALRDVEIVPEFRDAILAPDDWMRVPDRRLGQAAWSGDSRLYVHFTVGVPLESVRRLVDELLTRDDLTIDDGARRVARARAKQVDDLSDFLDGLMAVDETEDSACAKGYVMLVFLQVSALVDDAYSVRDRDSRRSQIKNRCMALSRVPLGELLRDDAVLDRWERRWICTHADAIAAQFGRLLDEGRGGGARFEDVLDDDLFTGVDGNNVTIRRFLDASLGSAPAVSQSETFGTTEFGTDVRTVAGRATVLVPLELRNLRPRNEHYRMSWSEFDQLCRDLQEFTREEAMSPDNAIGMGVVPMETDPPVVRVPE